MEEWEYVSYRCAYCGKFHPARKQRPAAPLLSTPARALPAPRAITLGKFLAPTLTSDLPLLWYQTNEIAPVLIYIYI